MATAERRRLSRRRKLARNGDGTPTALLLLVIDYSTNWCEVFGRDAAVVVLEEEKEKGKDGDGRAHRVPVTVEQTQWENIRVHSDSELGPTVCLLPEARPFTEAQRRARTVRPDFCLIRNFPTGLHGVDYKHTLMGLMFSDLPSVNSLHSIFMGMHRPLVYAEMLKIRGRLGKREEAQAQVQAQREVAATAEVPSESAVEPTLRCAEKDKARDAAESGSAVPSSLPPPPPPLPNILATEVKTYRERQELRKLEEERKLDDRRQKLLESASSYKFPLIDMHFYPNTAAPAGEHKDSIAEIDSLWGFPRVVKVGSPHAGFGKTRVYNQGELDDLRSILYMRRELFYTTEAFVDVDFEYRVQKIGDHYRGFKRNSTSSWKGNWGNITFEDFKLQPVHRMWADECAKMFGGLDILAIDVLRMNNGKDIIIEVNDTAPGFMYAHEKEDNRHIKELVLKRMSEKFIL